MTNFFGDHWEYLLITIGLVVFAWAFVLFFFLVPEPELVGIQISEHANSTYIHPEEATKLCMKKQITFMDALKLDRVLLYASCYFCTKLAVYCLLLWLPTFLKVDSNLQYSIAQVANLQTSVDLGAIFGSMILGYASDLLSGQRAPVALVAVLLATLISYSVTFSIYDLTPGLLLIAMFSLGFFINSLNNLISSVCAADLGKAVQGNHRAVATVTGIIDGTGSMGSALGQLIVGVTKDAWGWQWGYLLIVSMDINMTIIPVLIIMYLDWKKRL
jgi:MFS transporter, OPA family, solute carrier family 37 (glycerol-3-phosphate transporter), member 3